MNKKRDELYRGLAAGVVLVAASPFLVLGFAAKNVVYYAKPAGPSATLGLAPESVPAMGWGVAQPAPGASAAGDPAPAPASDTDLGGLDLGGLDLGDLGADLDVDKGAQLEEKATVSAGAPGAPAPAAKQWRPLPPPMASAGSAEALQSITGDAKKRWEADKSRFELVGALEMINFAIVGGIARSGGDLHLTGEQACPT